MSLNKNKINILLPVAGKAQRFLDQSYIMPKPLINVSKRHMIDWALDSMNIKNANLIFIVREDHILSFDIDKILKKKFGRNVKIVVAKSITEGAACTCLLAEKHINNDSPLVIYTPDVTFSKKWDPYTFKNDGHLLIFKSNSSAHSYAKVNEKGFVTQTAEKKVISDNAAVGVYSFKKGSDFVKAAKLMIDSQDKFNNEYYICPVYNYLIKDGKKITISKVDKMHVLGTPEDLIFFENNIINQFGDRPVALCSDHSGIELKNLFIKHLKKAKIEFIDYGSYVDTDNDYPDYVSQATKSILNNITSHGIGFCRSGQGVNITANKFKGIRSALIFDAYTAEYAIRHNSANFFSIPSKYFKSSDIKKIINVLKNSSFDGGRHKLRIDKISEIENY